MALTGLFCTDVPLRNYSLTHSKSQGTFIFWTATQYEFIAVNGKNTTSAFHKVMLQQH